VASNDLGISALRNNRAKEIETKFGATNFSYSPIKTWTLSGFGILSYSNTQIETNSESTILASKAQQKQMNHPYKNKLWFVKIEFNV